MNTQQEIEELYSGQLNEWEQFREQVLQLNKVEIHSFDFENYVIKTQYNPARAVSSNARLDEKSIAARKCFLCPENRPAVQREVRLNENFIALVNPFPILKEHFTLPLIQHRKQEILAYLDDMLDFARRLPDFTIFYNGPKAGASAPDHLHFQAVRKGQLPFEQEYLWIEKKILTEEGNGRISALQNYGRACLLIQSPDKKTICTLFKKVYFSLAKQEGKKAREQEKMTPDTLSGFAEEPMMNVFVLFENEQWNLFIFPRKAHRPSYFFAEGNDYKMISPGAIDIAGIFVLPRKEDFNSVGKEIIEDVLKQI